MSAQVGRSSVRLLFGKVQFHSRPSKSLKSSCRVTRVGWRALRPEDATARDISIDELELGGDGAFRSSLT